MPRKWLLLINFSIGAFVGVLLIATLTLAFLRPHEIVVEESQLAAKPLPKVSFTQSQEAYNAIGESLLLLKYSPPTMQIPNLKNVIVYFGPNGRPDSAKDATALHFALTDARAQASAAPGESLYLLYDRQQTPPRYVFSPNNAPTSLWIQAEPKGNDVLIKVMMKNQNGEMVQEPFANAQFSLQQKEYSRFSGSNASWELGKWRVDGTLLSRQRARWFGLDKFLERHGGEEFQQLATKQRVDFGEGEETYSVYVGLDDVLVWDNEHWKAVKPGKETQDQPIMQLKKVDERLLSFILWDSDGKNRINLNLLKSTENWIPKNLQQDFKFVAARTRSQYVFEINKDRMLLKPKDWLVLTDAGWKKLESMQDVDHFVERKITGPLFVFDGVVKKDDKQFLVGTLFNASRTDAQSMEIDLSQGNVTILTMPNDKPQPSPSPSLSPSPVQANKPAHQPMNEKIPETLSLPPQIMGNGHLIH